MTGEFEPNLRAGKFTLNNVTLRVAMTACAATALTKEQVAEVVQRITHAIREQAERHKKRGN